MAVEIRMPALTSDMTEADLIAWLVKPGDRVSEGDVIAEIETDKSTVELEATTSGVVLELTVAEGTQGVAVGTPLCRIDAADDAGEVPVEKAETPELENAPVVPDEPASAAGAPPPARDTTSAASATALARRMADQAGLDLRSIEGSGAGGRIVKADVDTALGGERSPGIAADSALQQQAPAPPVAIPHSRMRRTLAARLTQAKREVPHFYLRVECEVDRLLSVRSELNQADEVSVSINDFVVRAAALALREVPEANVVWSDEALLRFERVDVAVAVATDSGLITPILCDADHKGLAAIASEMRDLAERARAGSLRPDEYRGGTFCVSNLGMYGVESVYPILNTPAAGILGVGAARSSPVVRDGTLGVGALMTCTLSGDHRALDGATGARLLGAIKRRIEEPLEMLL